MTFFALILAMAIGIGVGLIMGLTGAGGGMLAVPALVYSQGRSMQQAMPVALLAAPMTSLGVLVAKNMSQRGLMLAFSVVLLIVVARLLFQIWKTQGDEGKADAMACVNRQTGKFDWNLKTASIISVIGACSGFATGLLGVGGGFIIVPLLRHFTNLTMQSAAATSLMVITLVGSVAVSSAIFHGAQLPVAFSAMFALSSVVGVLLGRRIANYLPSNTVQMIFAGMLFCVAINFIVKAY